MAHQNFPRRFSDAHYAAHFDLCLAYPLPHKHPSLCLAPSLDNCHSLIQTMHSTIPDPKTYIPELFFPSSCMSPIVRLL